MSPCSCGHPHDAHEHYRSGTDCSQCACLRFRRRRADWVVALTTLTRGPSVRPTPLPVRRALEVPVVEPDRDAG